MTFFFKQNYVEFLTIVLLWDDSESRLIIVLMRSLYHLTLHLFGSVPFSRVTNSLASYRYEQERSIQEIKSLQRFFYQYLCSVLLQLFG
jgi:hypothetical protein